MFQIDKKESARLERAVLVGATGRGVREEKSREYLDELALLTRTAGAEVLCQFYQKLDRVDPRTYVGSGKLNEIAAFIKENEVELIVFDDDLSPSQLRNIEEVVETKVMDRSGIILHIFVERARTAQAKAQVELAQLQYLLPRLTGLWTHHSRQKGGIGMKGAGEKEIETDKRMIRRKIDLLKEDLIKIEKQGLTRRKGREQLIRVSLVGYTNAGKSTLMNALSKSDVLAENKLFATLDTTVRKVVVDQVPFLLSDTVGFIRKLPHDLIESFKSTLEEVREADLLLHVIDVTHAGFNEHMQVVSETLAEIGAADKKMILVFNKVDALSENDFENLKETWGGKVDTFSVFISARNRDNLAELRDLVVKETRKLYRLRYPYKNKDEEPWFYTEYDAEMNPIKED